MPKNIHTDCGVSGQFMAGHEPVSRFSDEQQQQQQMLDGGGVACAGSKLSTTNHNGAGNNKNSSGSRSNNNNNTRLQILARLNALDLGRYTIYLNSLMEIFNFVRQHVDVVNVAYRPSVPGDNATNEPAVGTPSETENSHRMHVYGGIIFWYIYLETVATTTALEHFEYDREFRYARTVDIDVRGITHPVDHSASESNKAQSVQRCETLREQLYRALLQDHLNGDQSQLNGAYATIVDALQLEPYTRHVFRDSNLGHTTLNRRDVNAVELLAENKIKLSAQGSLKNFYNCKLQMDFLVGQRRGDTTEEHLFEMDIGDWGTSEYTQVYDLPACQMHFRGSVLMEELCKQFNRIQSFINYDRGMSRQNVVDAYRRALVDPTNMVKYKQAFYRAYMVYTIFNNIDQLTDALINLFSVTKEQMLDIIDVHFSAAHSRVLFSESLHRRFGNFEKLVAQYTANTLINDDDLLTWFDIMVDQFLERNKLLGVKL